MLTTQDKKYIDRSITDHIDKALTKNNQILIQGMRELFDVTNERIDQTNKRIDQANGRIDKVLAQLKSHNDILDNHERRVEKIEEKVFTTISS